MSKVVRALKEKTALFFQKYNPKLREHSAWTYANTIKKIYELLEKDNGNVASPKLWKHNPEQPEFNIWIHVLTHKDFVEPIIQVIENNTKSINTKKNYYATMCALYHLVVLKDNRDFQEYHQFQIKYDVCADLIKNKKKLQEPTKKDLENEGTTIEDLRKHLWKWKVGAKVGNIVHLKYYMVGLFHTELLLRNEIKDTHWAGETYKEAEGNWKYRNFIYGSKYKKWLVIRVNKVRHPDQDGYKERVISLVKLGDT